MSFAFSGGLGRSQRRWKIVTETGTSYITAEDEESAWAIAERDYDGVLAVALSSMTIKVR